MFYRIFSRLRFLKPKPKPEPVETAIMDMITAEPEPGSLLDPETAPGTLLPPEPGPLPDKLIEEPAAELPEETELLETLPVELDPDAPGKALPEFDGDYVDSIPADIKPVAVEPVDAVIEEPEPLPMIDIDVPDEASTIPSHFGEKSRIVGDSRTIPEFDPDEKEPADVAPETPMEESSDDEPKATEIEETEPEEPDPKQRIKGNISSAKGAPLIYHKPGSEYYDRVKIDESVAERWFDSEEEAIRAGWRPPR